MDATLASRHAALDVLVACSTRASARPMRWPLTGACQPRAARSRLRPPAAGHDAASPGREIDEVLGALIERPIDAPTPPAGKRCGWARHSLFLARRLMPRSTRRCGWSSMPACRISRVWPTPCCAAWRARAWRSWDRDPARLQHAAMAGQSWLDTYGEETHAPSPRIIWSRHARPHAARQCQFWAGQLDGALLATARSAAPTGGAITELPGFAEGAWWVQAPPPPCPPICSATF